MSDQPQDQPRAGATLRIGLQGIVVEFPDGYWDDPSHDLVLRDGRTMRDARIEGLAALIIKGLQKALRERTPTSRLLGADGRPIT